MCNGTMCNGKNEIIFITGECYWNICEEINVEDIFQAKINSNEQYMDYIDNLLCIVNGWEEMKNLEWEELEESNV